MIDSHCHLTASQFKSDRDDVLSRARAEGISPMITIAESMTDAADVAVLCAEYDDVYGTVGVHPHNASSFQEEDLIKLTDLTTQKNIVGIGEIGLDYHYDNSPRDIQRDVFEKQLALATELNLPAVVHTREAIEDTWEVVSRTKPQKLVLHCCTERFEDVERFVSAGYLLSFTGIATYPKAEEIRDTIARCPLEQMMIETDAPFLSPVPHRGKRNEPAFVREVARCIAEIKGISLEDVDRVTTQTTTTFFGL